VVGTGRKVTGFSRKSSKSGRIRKQKYDARIRRLAMLGSGLLSTEREERVTGSGVGERRYSYVIIYHVTVTGPLPFTT